MMINTGADVLPAGQVGHLLSPLSSGSTQTECVNFWYYMGGLNPGETPPTGRQRSLNASTVPGAHVAARAGSLTVYMKMRSGERMRMFFDHLGQGDMWRHGSGNLRSTLEEWQVGPPGLHTWTSTQMQELLVQGHEGTSAGADLLCSCAAQLEFEVVGAGGTNTFIAIDDIFISSHACPDQGGWQSPVSVGTRCWTLST